jgi:hypothetical protein
MSTDVCPDMDRVSLVEPQCVIVHMTDKKFSTLSNLSSGVEHW